MDASKFARELALIKSKLEKLEGYPILERTYQKFLETEFRGSHVKCAFGYSDVETDTLIIEIKHFSQYKYALGQLLSYNYGKHKNMKVYFFGEKPKNIFQICNLFRHYNIEVYYIWQNDDRIINYEKLTCCEQKTNIGAWLSDHVVYQKDGVLLLKDIIGAFAGAENLHSHHASVFRKNVEQFIKSRFPNIKFQYGVCKNNNKSYKG